MFRNQTPGMLQDPATTVSNWGNSLLRSPLVYAWHVKKNQTIQSIYIEKQLRVEVTSAAVIHYIHALR